MVRPPRRLPQSTFNSGNVDVPDVGRFALVGVGSTRYSTGIQVHVHLHGEEEAQQGYMHFRLSFTDDMEPIWSHDEKSGAHMRKTPFDDRIIAAAKVAIEEAMPRAPNEYLFQLMDRMSMELDDFDRRKRDLQEWVAQYEALQSGRQPTKIKPEEIEQRLASARRRLDLLKETPRLTRLRAARDALRNWTKSSGGQPLADIIAEHMNVPAAAPAP